MSGPLDVAGSHSAHRECKACGNYTGNAARIKDLENEVQLLTDQATAAADRLADYETEIRALKTSRTDSPVDATLLSPDGLADPTAFLPPGPLSRQASSTGRFSFLSAGRSKALPAVPPPPEAASLADAHAALARETAAREHAEAKAAALSGEIEELSVTLFEQANEMVAAERRVRAKLEERVLALEQRDRDRGRRLERIEGAVARLDRVRTLLAP
ncbi:hypothetical protein MBLNU459_g4764t1 [Dothideomycetes sp. NU459]